MKPIRLSRNQKGFSLIEVIVSMAMLAIVVVPLLNYFVSSAQYNARAKTRQNATVLAQSIIEECKDKTLAEIAGSYTATTSPGSGILCYEIVGLQEDGNKYDALITIDTNKYALVNQTPLTNVYTINSPRNIVAVESTTQNTLALNQMISSNSARCDTENADNQGKSGYPISKASELEIQNALKRIMVINIDANMIGSNPKAKIYYKYYCDPYILGCPVKGDAIEMDPPLYNETVSMADLENIYLFFNKINTTQEELEFYINDSNPSSFQRKFNLYLLCQAEVIDDKVPEECNVNIYQRTANAFEKLNKVLMNVKSISFVNGSASAVSTEYITKTASTRMVNLKVDIYKSGQMNQPDFLYATLNATKQE